MACCPGQGSFPAKREQSKPARHETSRDPALASLSTRRREASEQLHRPARHMALRALAEEMEAHAATWQLLFCVYCDEQPPAGDGGAALPGTGGAQLYRQRTADCIASHRELARCARSSSGTCSGGPSRLRSVRNACGLFPTPAWQPPAQPELPIPALRQDLLFAWPRIAPPSRMHSGHVFCVHGHSTGPDG